MVGDTASFLTFLTRHLLKSKEHGCTINEWYWGYQALRAYKKAMAMEEMMQALYKEKRIPFVLSRA